MLFLGALWLITSSYSQQLAVYPSMELCGAFREAMAIVMNKPPRPVLAKVICVPVPFIPPASGEPKFSM